MDRSTTGPGNTIFPVELLRDALHGESADITRNVDWLLRRRRIKAFGWLLRSRATASQADPFCWRSRRDDTTTVRGHYRCSSVAYNAVDEQTRWRGEENVWKLEKEKSTEGKTTTMFPGGRRFTETVRRVSSIYARNDRKRLAVVVRDENNEKKNCKISITKRGTLFYDTGGGDYRDDRFVVINVITHTTHNSHSGFLLLLLLSLSRPTAVVRARALLRNNNWVGNNVTRARARITIIRTHVLPVANVAIRFLANRLKNIHFQLIKTDDFF